MKMFRKSEGFTLVELMVVVLIIGILVAIAVPVFLNASANAAAKSCQANQRTISGAISTYNASNTDSVIPTSTVGILSSTTAFQVLWSATKGTMKSAPVCPSKVGTTDVLKGQYWVAVDYNITGDQGIAGATNIVDKHLL